MKQREIMALLHEAAQLATNRKAHWKRLNEIQGLLNDATYNNHEGQDPLCSRAAALRTMCNSLFCDTMIKAPACLPDLFPVFAMLCGDHDGTIISTIDWTLYA